MVRKSNQFIGPRCPVRAELDLDVHEATAPPSGLKTHPQNCQITLNSFKELLKLNVLDLWSDFDVMLIDIIS